MTFEDETQTTSRTISLTSFDVKNCADEDPRSAPPLRESRTWSERIQTDFEGTAGVSLSAFKIGVAAHHGIAVSESVALEAATPARSVAAGHWRTLEPIRVETWIEGKASIDGIRVPYGALLSLQLLFDDELEQRHLCPPIPVADQFGRDPNSAATSLEKLGFRATVGAITTSPPCAAVERGLDDGEVVAVVVGQRAIAPEDAEQPIVIDYRGVNDDLSVYRDDTLWVLEWNSLNEGCIPQLTAWRGALITELIQIDFEQLRPSLSP